MLKVVRIQCVCHQSHHHLSPDSLDLRLWSDPARPAGCTPALWSNSKAPLVFTAALFPLQSSSCERHNPCFVVSNSLSCNHLLSSLDDWLTFDPQQLRIYCHVSFFQTAPTLKGQSVCEKVVANSYMCQGWKDSSFLMAEWVRHPEWCSRWKQ